MLNEIWAILFLFLEMANVQQTPPSLQGELRISLIDNDLHQITDHAVQAGTKTFETANYHETNPQVLLKWSNESISRFAS